MPDPSIPYTIERIAKDVFTASNITISVALSLSWIPLYAGSVHILLSREFKQLKEMYQEGKIPEKPAFWNVEELVNTYLSLGPLSKEEQSKEQLS